MYEIKNNFIQFFFTMRVIIFFKLNKVVLYFIKLGFSTTLREHVKKSKRRNDMWKAYSRSKTQIFILDGWAAICFSHIFSSLAVSWRHKKPFLHNCRFSRQWTSRKHNEIIILRKKEIKKCFSLLVFYFDVVKSF